MCLNTWPHVSEIAQEGLGSVAFGSDVSLGMGFGFEVLKVNTDFQCLSLFPVVNQDGSSQLLLQHHIYFLPFSSL